MTIERYNSNTASLLEKAKQKAVLRHLSSAQEQINEIEDEATRYALLSLKWAIECIAGVGNTPAAVQGDPKNIV